MDVLSGIVQIVLGIAGAALAAVFVYWLKIVMKKNPEILSLLREQEVQHNALNKILVKLELPPMEELKREYENESNFVDIFCVMLDGLSKQYKDNPIIAAMQTAIETAKKG